MTTAALGLDGATMEALNWFLTSSGGGGGATRGLVHDFRVSQTTARRHTIHTTTSFKAGGGGNGDEGDIIGGNPQLAALMADQNQKNAAGTMTEMERQLLEIQRLSKQAEQLALTAAIGALLAGAIDLVASYYDYHSNMREIDGCEETAEAIDELAKERGIDVGKCP